MNRRHILKLFFGSGAAAVGVLGSLPAARGEVRSVLSAFNEKLQDRFQRQVDFPSGQQAKYYASIPALDEQMNRNDERIQQVNQEISKLEQLVSKLEESIVESTDGVKKVRYIVEEN
ncbi:hypothetical protein MYX78_10670 [Acidobacteria bacterium AH-259-G07]|nr:hypothetical protein [Acidobacteria bacterium AH-259-G07]